MRLSGPRAREVAAPLLRLRNPLDPVDLLHRLACSGNDRRFLYRHRNDVVPAVDAKVGSDAERQLEIADRVLDEAVRPAVEREEAAVEIPIGIEAADRADFAEALL